MPVATLVVQADNEKLAKTIKSSIKVREKRVSVKSSIRKSIHNVAVMLILSIVFSNSIPASAQDKAQSFDTLFKGRLINTISGQVTKIIDPLRIEINHKEIIQLSNLDIPDFTVHEIGPLSQTILDGFNGTLLNKQITVFQSPQTDHRINRMGYHVGQIIMRSDNTEKNIWIQRELIAAGLARLRPSETNTEIISELIILENDAIDARRGYWAQDNAAHYTALYLNNTPRYGQWAVVDGTVKKVANVKNYIFLNFGEDWRTDFTVSINAGQRRKLSREGFNIFDLGGKTIRVRGWLEDYNGTSIQLMDPAWLGITPAIKPAIKDVSTE